MNIYIASSYRNIHLVRLLRDRLALCGHAIVDWTAFVPSFQSGYSAAQRKKLFDSSLYRDTFQFCVTACASVDCLVYVGPAGQDAGCEVGIAYAEGIPVVGLAGPMEEPGLILHHCVSRWFHEIEPLLTYLEDFPSGFLRDSLTEKRDA